MGEERCDVLQTFGARVPMRDGVTLSADIWRPRSDGPVPAVLVRTPYVKATAATAAWGRRFSERGFAFVAMDVRGRGDSDGLFVPYRNDAQDGHDAIEWLAEQPWCDGNVGTWGTSYLARIQWLTALTHPRHLRAMVSMVTPSDPFVEWPTGTPSPMHLCWHHLVSGRTLQHVEAVDWTRVYEHLPLLTMDEASGRLCPHWREELSHPTLDEFWRPLCYQTRFAELDLPVLHISGWYDDEQVGTPLNFMGMRRHARSPEARRAQRLIMGPWPHGVLDAPTKLGEVDFGPSAKVDLGEMSLRWFETWLMGKDTGVADEPPVRLFVMGANEWRTAEDWPLPETRGTRFYLRSGGRANSRFGDGVLSTEPPSGDEPPDRYTYDPMRPVPFLTDPLSHQIGGPDDYAAVERRDDVLVYTTPPLARDLEVVGPVTLVLYAASDAPDTDFMAKLCDAWPNGFVQRLTDGMVRARYREGMHHEAPPLHPGEVVAYTVDLWNTAQRFKRGHAIRLEIASSAFPKYDRNLNTGSPLATDRQPRVAHQSVFHTASHPSHLVLPVVGEGEGAGG